MDFEKEKTAPPSSSLQINQFNPDRYLKMKLPERDFGTFDEFIEEREKVQEAQVRTARNTEDIKVQLNKVIQNQNDYIELLKDNHKRVIQTLENIFASSEDSAIIQKELLSIMADENVNEELLKDKGMDVFVQGLFLCFNILLAKWGIKL